MMDYLEGFLLGPVWSDTEYETRSHKVFFFFLSLTVLGLFALILFRSDVQAYVFLVRREITLLTTVVLFLVMPFIHAVYYRIPFFLRPIFLLFSLVRFVLLYVCLFQYLVPLVDVNFSALPNMITDYINHQVSETTAFFSFLGSIFGMLVGLIVGGIFVGLQGLLLLLVFIALPVLVLFLAQAVQRLLDRITYRLLFREEF